MSTNSTPVTQTPVDIRKVVRTVPAGDTVVVSPVHAQALGISLPSATSNSVTTMQEVRF